MRKFSVFDKRRDQQIKRKATDTVMKRRKKLRKLKKGIEDNEAANEKDESYVPGGF